MGSIRSLALIVNNLMAIHPIVLIFQSRVAMPRANSLAKHEEYVKCINGTRQWYTNHITPFSSMPMFNNHIERNPLHKKESCQFPHQQCSQSTGAELPHSSPAAFHLASNKE